MMPKRMTYSKIHLKVDEKTTSGIFVYGSDLHINAMKKKPRIVLDMPKFTKVIKVIIQYFRIFDNEFKNYILTFMKAYRSYTFINLISEFGGWTGIVIGIR